jgi:hypothetical protein
MACAVLLIEAEQSPGSEEFYTVPAPEFDPILLNRHDDPTVLINLSSYREFAICRHYSQKGRFLPHAALGGKLRDMSGEALQRRNGQKPRNSAFGLGARLEVYSTGCKYIHIFITFRTNFCNAITF